MTEEELEKEAEEYDFVIRFKSNKPKYEIRSYIINHILDEFDNLQMWDFKRSSEFAEPREKWIAHLEAQIEQNKIDLAISEHDREHNDYELTEAYKKIEQLEKENADLKCECRTCVYMDSPCVRSDYPSKDGVCSHYKNVFDEIAELKQENKVLAQNLEDTEILNKTYEKRFNDLEKENAELKEQRFSLRNERNTFLVQNEQYEKDLIDFNENLTNAKDLLLRFVELKNKPCASGHSINMLLYENICAETEQFLNSENIILEDAKVGNSPFDADEVFNKEMKVYPEQFLKDSEVEK